jgi:hypothetical protein
LISPEAPPSRATGTEKPMVLAVSMGYGHLRAAKPIADLFGVPVSRADEAPFAGAAELERWRKTRAWYEWVSRAATHPGLGAIPRLLLDKLTDIPPRDLPADLSQPTRGARYLKKLIDQGFGATLALRVREANVPVVTTFYAVALMLENRVDVPIYCVVTDSDINRVWAPVDSRHTRIRFLVPCEEVASRLYAYGVPEAQVRVTGFPLPAALVGGRERTQIKHSLERRLARLDPLGTFDQTFHDPVASALGPIREASGPIQLMFAVGGAGAQAGLVEGLLPAVAPLVDQGELGLLLVAGVRPRVREHFERVVRQTGLERHLGKAIRILACDSLGDYLARFEAELSEADLLLTKPSELTFCAALGLPLLLSAPVGVHEERNQQWAAQYSAALDLPEIGKVGWWLRARLADGSLARIAWNGYTRLTATGVYDIAELTSGGWR